MLRVVVYVGALYMLWWTCWVLDWSPSLSFMRSYDCGLSSRHLISFAHICLNLLIIILRNQFLCISLCVCSEDIFSNTYSKALKVVVEELTYFFTYTSLLTCIFMQLPLHFYADTIIKCEASCIWVHSHGFSY